MMRESQRFLCRGGFLVLLAAGAARAEVVELATGSDAVLYGLHPSANTGSTLVPGDFDGDGRTDLAIGASGGSPEFEPNACPGIIYIVWGGPDAGERLAAGLHKLPNRIAGARHGQGIGGNVAAGDFDGDGRTDLLIGAPWTTEPGSPEGGGAAYLVLGRPREDFPPMLVLPDAADAVFLPDQREIHLGEAVALGDFDGDGKADAAIGAMYQNGFDNTRPHAGATYLVLGRKRDKLAERIPVVKNADLAIHGGDRDDTSGRGLAFSDFNGDRRQDLVVGAYYGNGPFNTRESPGEAYVVLGREAKKFRSGNSRVLDLGVQGVATPIFGVWKLGATARSLAGGDFDGDGWGDVAVGTYIGPSTEERFHCGIVDVAFGAFTMPEAFDLEKPGAFRILGGYRYDQAGRPLAAGDLDGDGREELLVGATFADPTGPDGMPRLQAGILGVVTGRPRLEPSVVLDLSSNAFDHTLHGIDPEDQLPSAAAALDLDADGKADLVVGAGGSAGRDNAMTGAGEVYFLFGAKHPW